LLSEPHFRPFDITGHAMRGWAMAEPEAVESRDDLERCVSLAVDFVMELPPKSATCTTKSRGARPLNSATKRRRRSQN
jgi:hypothetical protein